MSKSRIIERVKALHLRVVFAMAVSLLGVRAVQAQPEMELIQSLDPAQERRLEEYNSVFLKKQTYFASRYRIAKVDSEALLRQGTITITPLVDARPIRLQFRRLDRHWNEHLFWHGEITVFPMFPVTISMHAWDVEDSGTAVYSGPDTHAFFSVSGVIDLPGMNKFVVEPLQYTPRYSVIYEIARDAVIPIRIDIMPGDPPLSDREKTVLKQYREFLDALPDEKDKRVLGDIR